VSVQRTAVAKTVLVALVLSAVFLITIPWLIIRSTEAVIAANRLPLRLVGLALIGFGVYLYAWSVRHLLARETSALPGVTPSQLETSGWYGRVRHPLLLGVVAVLLGEAALFASLPLLTYALIYWLWLHVFVTRKEEPDLLAAFGDAYHSYTQEVPRWIPSFRHARRLPPRGTRRGRPPGGP
jgi:protein-S-isoprenylcysteine O-methyltransferase Ste14